MSFSDTDLTAADVSWDLSGLLSDVDASSPRELVERAQVLADDLQHYKGTIAHISSDELFDMMSVLSETSELLSRAGHFTTLKFSENTADPEIAAEMQFINEQANSVSTKLLFIDLEWAELSSERSRDLLIGDRFDFCRHHLENMRRYQPHQLSEPEETVLSETSLTGASAWVRLFEEHTSAIEVELPESLGGRVSLMSALANLHAPDTSSREQAAHAISSALEPGLRTRAFIYNTLLLDKLVDDRLRDYPTWITSRNMANEASDESVQALIDAVVARYDIPQKWYALKAQVLGVDQLRDFDRMASVATSDTSIGWEEGSTVVREAYASFSPELAAIVGRFIDERWIDAPVRPGKRGVRSVHMRSLPITRTCCSIGHRLRATLRHLPMNSVTVFTASSLENKEFSINRRLSHLLKQHPCSVRPSRTTGCSQCLKTRANGSHFSQQRLKTRSQPYSVRWR